MRTVICNIQTLVSGDIHRPLLDADAIRIDGGRIAAPTARSRQPAEDNPHSACEFPDRGLRR